MMKYLYAFIISCLLGSAVFAEMRVWESMDGRTFKAEYVREQFDLFYFRDEHRHIQKIAVTNLIPSHVRYIRTIVPPKLSLSFRKKIEEEEGRYADPDTRLVKTTASVRKVSKAPFVGTLTGELYLVAKEVATPDYMVLAKKTFEIRFPQDEDTVTVELNAQTREYDEYNEKQRRGRNYEGYLLVVTSASGEVLKTDTDLKWIDEETIDQFRKFKVFTFFNNKCERRSVPRPQSYSPRGFI